MTGHIPEDVLASRGVPGDYQGSGLHYSFFGMNGYDFDAPETEVVTTIERVAAGELREASLAGWFRKGI